MIGLSAGRERMVSRRRVKSAARSTSYWLLAGFVSLVFVIGGSQRADVQSLIVVRPTAALLCGYGLWKLTRERYEDYAALYWLLGATLLLCLLHLFPLPPTLWRALPARDVVAHIQAAAAMPDGWRPITLVAPATWNALFSLLVPLAALLLATSLNDKERAALLPLVIGLGLASGVLGLLQVLSPTDSPLYLYRLSNEGRAVGLFANRNHAAVYLACLFPMLAAYAGRPAPNFQRARFHQWSALAAGLVLVPMIVASGSRAAFLLAVPALASVPLIYRPAAIEFRDRRRHRGSRNRKGLRYAIMAISGVMIPLVALMLARSPVLGRFLALRQGDEFRTQIWGGILDDVWRFFPVGSGIGSFVEAYQLNEPEALLNPSYLNHAHNDPLEIAMTAGLPGILLLAAALIVWTRHSFNVWRRANDSVAASFGRMASTVLFILCLASIVDYPLRTPSLACFAILAAVWLVASSKGGDGRAE